MKKFFKGLQWTNLAGLVGQIAYAIRDGGDNINVMQVIAIAIQGVIGILLPSVGPAHEIAYGEKQDPADR